MQKDMVQQLDGERQMLLAPLVERKKHLLDSLAAILLTEGPGSTDFADESALLKQALDAVANADKETKQLQAEPRSSTWGKRLSCMPLQSHAASVGGGRHPRSGLGSSTSSPYRWTWTRLWCRTSRQAALRIR